MIDQSYLWDDYSRRYLLAIVASYIEPYAQIELQARGDLYAQATTEEFIQRRSAAARQKGVHIWSSLWKVRLWRYFSRRNYIYPPDSQPDKALLLPQPWRAHPLSVGVDSSCSWELLHGGYKSLPNSSQERRRSVLLCNIYSHPCNPPQWDRNDRQTRQCALVL